MATIHLITGGSRSGKSRRALELGQGLGTRRTFVATCPPIDAEMVARIERHRAERRGAGWQTVEEPYDLAAAIAAADGDVVLVDCLTLWVSNLLLRSDSEAAAFGEDRMVSRCEEVLAACAERGGDVLFVTNEVGLGGVPDNELARRFRDLAGRCNQTVAAAAERVTLMVSGLPLELK
jgi:adenosylcobinamide kinase/adenosylcobinamide-phosphate guanylyltransferase